MEHNIGVGAIIGLVTASSFYIYNSNKFNSIQKTILLICILFPPAQWLGIIIVLAYNNYIENNSVEKVTERKIEQKTNTLNSQAESLKDLKEKGILTEEEYSQKVNRIEQEKKEENLKNSQEYKQLKSLFDSGVLTKEEFESKIGIIKTKTSESKSNSIENKKPIEKSPKDNIIQSSKFKYEIANLFNENLCFYELNYKNKIYGYYITKKTKKVIINRNGQKIHFNSLDEYIENIIQNDLTITKKNVVKAT